MKTALKLFLAGLIHIENEAIKASGVELNQKELMSSNGWDKLPEKVLTHIKCRELLQRVVHFIEFTAPASNDPNSTNIARLEEITYNFFDDFENWLSLNEEKFPVVQINDQFKEMFTAGRLNKEDQANDNSFFSFLMSHVLLRDSFKRMTKGKKEIVEQPEPPQPEPEAA